MKSLAKNQLPPLAFLSWKRGNDLGIVLVFETHRTGIRVFALYVVDWRNGGEVAVDLPISPDLELKLPARALIAADLLKT